LTVMGASVETDSPKHQHAIILVNGWERDFSAWSPLDLYIFLSMSRSSSAEIVEGFPISVSEAQQRYRTIMEN